jgi:chemotaxis protein CheD
MSSRTLYIGDFFAAREPMELNTVVGSCIAVCLIDRRAGVGGMNHFMLPAPGPGRNPTHDRARFGVHAMDLLMGAMLKAGADRRAIVAKIFGGAHVLLVPESDRSIPQCNIRFIEEFMAVEGFRVLSCDVGGYLPRRLRFHTDTGKVYVHRLGDKALQQARVEEREHLAVVRRAPAPTGDVTLFEPMGSR